MDRFRWQIRMLIRSGQSIPTKHGSALFKKLEQQFQQYRTSDDRLKAIFADANRSDHFQEGAFGVSIDGIQPVGIDEIDAVRYHALVKSMRHTAMWINCWKRIFSPTVISLLRLSQDLRASEGGPAWESLIDRFDDFAPIGGSYKSRVKLRVTMRQKDAYKLAKKFKTPNTLRVLSRAMPNGSATGTRFDNTSIMTITTAGQLTTPSAAAS
ncbi:unnamed protein product [Zymoseptoria tritici ST99CH_1E4]|uniref:Uncharacterized protein n=1 Tax=Zymoseptoria tritici ST99CH_1E4 TaxID=1276532 RepID=A0A2H1FKV0_ZYMTR|nr:unnamed protein product [Zymoseptoria tritici ST99CH_1E4]